jgi:rubrerythrin
VKKEVNSMNSIHKPKLTSAEISALWTQYQNETAGICFNKHMMEHIEDNDIKDLFEYAISLGTKHIERIKDFFNNEGYPVPVGFTNQDVTLNKPRLFSDVFCLHYLNIMSIHGSHGYSGFVTTCSRHDIREYYTECNASAIELCNRTKNVLQEKGLYFRPPVLTPPERTEFVTDDNFVAGWLGDKRPLSCIEITDIYFNLKKSIFAKAMTVAFSQITQNKQVRKFLLKAVDTKNSHIQMFQEVLNQADLPSPPTFDAEITNTTASPFSEKHMVVHIGFLFSTAMTYYGTGLASSMRRDLIPKYTKAVTEDLKIIEKFTDLMIENGWLEQPPLAEDRGKLAKEK